MSTVDDGRFVRACEYKGRTLPKFNHYNRYNTRTDFDPPKAEEIRIS